MFTTLIKKVLGSRNERTLRRMQKAVLQISALEPSMQALSDAKLACVKQSPVVYHVGDQEAYWPEMLWAGHPTWRQDFLATAMEYTENLVYGSILVQLVLQNAREVRTYEFTSTGLFFIETPNF